MTGKSCQDVQQVVGIATGASVGMRKECRCAAAGHVDNMCCFIRPGVVALAWSDNPDDPQVGFFPLPD